MLLIENLRDGAGELCRWREDLTVWGTHEGCYRRLDLYDQSIASQSVL